MNRYRYIAIHGDWLAATIDEDWGALLNRIRGIGPMLQRVISIDTKGKRPPLDITEDAVLASLQTMQPWEGNRTADWIGGDSYGSDVTMAHRDYPYTR